MARKLSDIRPGDGSVDGEGVSLVHRGANRRRFLLAKADTGELDADVAEILAAPVAKEAELLEAVRASNGDESVEKAAATAIRAFDALRGAYDGSLPDDVAKAMRAAMHDEPDGDEGGDGEDDYDGDEDTQAVKKAYDEVCKKDYDAETRRKMAANGEAMKDGSYPIADRGDLQDAIHAIGRGNAPHADIRAHIIRRAKALGAASLLPDTWNVQKEDTVTETATAVPVRKDDGTWDLSAVPEDQRDAVQKALELADEAREAEVAELRKQAEAEQTKADEAIQIAKAERDARETREYVAKSEKLDRIAKDDDEFGAVLKAIARAEADEHLPAGTVEKLDTVLAAANEQIEKSALFAERGRAGHGGSGGDAMSKIEKAGEEIRKADPKLTKEQAIAKALKDDPSLYAEYQKEMV